MGVGLDLVAARRDGTEFPVEISLNTVPGAEQAHLLVTIRDITERRTAAQQKQALLESRAAEEALTREKDCLAVTLRSIGDGVIATDTSSRVTLMNPVAEALTGWTQTEASSIRSSPPSSRAAAWAWPWCTPWPASTAATPGSKPLAPKVRRSPYGCRRANLANQWPWHRGWQGCAAKRAYW